MAIIEFREFYLRAVSVPAGTKKDQETNYITQYQVTDVNGNEIMAFNRFLKDHFPSEDVFKKFLESITFKLNPEDKATDDQQGLVRLVTGLNIVNREDKDVITYVHPNITATGDFITVVLPSTLPIVSAGSGISINVIIRNVSNDAVATTPYLLKTLYYVDYEVTNTAPHIPPAVVKDYVGSPFKLDFKAFVNMSVDPDDPDYLVIGTHTIIADKLINDFSHLLYDVYWVSADNNSNEPSIKVFIGNDDDIGNCVLIGTYFMLDAANINKKHINSIDLKLHRRGDDGYFAKADQLYYETSSPEASFLTNGKGFLDVGNGNLFVESIKVQTKGSDNEAQIDWTSDMKIHFRIFAEGVLATENSVENKVRIYGYAINP